MVNIDPTWGNKELQARLTLLEGRIEDLEEIERRYRRLRERTIDFIFIHDLNGQFIEANPSTLRALGYSALEIQKINVRDVIHPDYLERVLSAIRPESVLEPEPQYLEARIIKPSGTHLWVEVCSWPMKFRGALCIQGIARDITDRKRMEAELRYQQEFLTAIVDTDPNLVFVKDENLRFTFVNQALADLYGKTKGDLIGQTDDENPPTFTELNAFRTADREVLVSGQPKYIPKESVTGKDYRRRWFKTIKIRFKAPDESHQVLGVATEVTERVEAEDKLQLQKEELLRETKLLDALMESSLDAIYFKDTSGRFVRVNEALTQFVGALSPKEMIGKSDFDYFPEEYSVTRQAEEQLIMSTRKPIVGQTILTQPPVGQARYRETSKVPILNPSTGEVTGLIGISRDIHEKAALKEALTQRTELLQQVLDAVPQCIFWKDRSSTYLGCNRSFARRHGFDSPGKVVGMTDYLMSPGNEEANRFRAADEKVMDRDQPQLQYREQQLLPNGQVRILETSKMPLHNEKGFVIGVLGVYEDVTKRVEDYEALVRFISHSLKSRVATIEANLTGLTRKWGEVGEVERLTYAVNSLKRAVLKAKQFSSLQSKARAEKVLIRQLVQDVVRAVGDQRIRLITADPQAVVIGNRLDLENALFELLSNAQDFAPQSSKGGEIILRTVVKGDYCQIHISDNGPGLVKSHGNLKQFPVPSDASRTGLGLLFVRYVVEKHVGTLNEIGMQGKGAHFVVELPLVTHSVTALG